MLIKYGRELRTLPIAGTEDGSLKTPKIRVIPPSVGHSYMISASLTPSKGCPECRLFIIMAIGRLFTLSLLKVKPVSGFMLRFSTLEVAFC